MAIIDLDIKFCRELASVAAHPDIVSPRRPTGGNAFHRIKAAWLVLIGKADALVWPSNGGAS